MKVRNGTSAATLPPFPNKSNPPSLSFSSPCMNNDGTCNGTMAYPYEIGSLSMTGGGKGDPPVLELIGGPDIFHPIYCNIDSQNENQGSIEVSGYVVLNIQSSLNISGQGMTSGVTPGGTRKIYGFRCIR